MTSGYAAASSCGFLWVALLAADAAASTRLFHIAVSPVLATLFAASALTALLSFAAVSFLSAFFTGRLLRLQLCEPSLSKPMSSSAAILATALCCWAAAASSPPWWRDASSFWPGFIALLLLAPLLSSVLLASLLRLSPRSRQPVLLHLATASGLAIWGCFSYYALEARISNPVGALALAVMLASLLAYRFHANSGPDGGSSRPLAVSSLAAGILLPLLILGAVAGGPAVQAAGRGRPAMAVAAGGASAGKANVVLIVIDTLRADRCSLHPYRRDTTPFLLRRAKRCGTYFSQALSAGAATVLSVKSMLTSRQASTWGFEQGNKAPPLEAWTMAEAFHSAGY